MKYQEKKFYGGRFRWYISTFVFVVLMNFFLPLLREYQTGFSPAQTVIRQMDNSGLSLTEQEQYKSRVQEDFYEGRSVPLRFAVYLKNIVTLNLGYSVSYYPQHTWSLVRGGLSWSLVFQVPTIIVSILLGAFLGRFLFHSNMMRRMFLPLITFFSAVPYVVSSFLLLYVFGVKLHWFPTMGGYGDGVVMGFNITFLLSALYHLILPFMALSLVVMSSQALTVYGDLVAESRRSYRSFAYKIGFSKKSQDTFLFRNALLLQLPIVARRLSFYIGGAMLIEIILSYPGLGTVLFEGIYSDDIPVVQSVVLVVTLYILMLHFLLDVIVHRYTPHAIHYESEKTNESL